MRFRFTLFLVLLNFGLAAAIYILGTRGGDEATARGSLVREIGSAITDAERFELHSSRVGQVRILERTGSGWDLVAPVQWPANVFAINRILNQLKFVEEEAAFQVEEIERRGQTLEDYGLAEPNLLLRFHSGGEEMEIAFGAPTEIGNNVYLLGPDKRRVYVVSRSVISDITLDLDELRSREIFTIPVFEVDTLVLAQSVENDVEGGTLQTRLVRSRDSWRFETPLEARADASLVSSTLNELINSKVTRFVESAAVNRSIMGLDEPAMRVTLQGNRRRQTLLVGATDSGARQPSYFAQLEGNDNVFTVPQAAFESLFEANEALRERNFLAFEIDETTGIEIAEGDQLVRLQRLETGVWQILEKDGENDVRTRRADQEVVNRLLNRLNASQALGFMADAPSASDLARFGFEAPRREVRLLRNSETLQQVTLAHPEEENERLFAITDGQTVYDVPRRPLLNLLPLNPIQYRDRTLDRLPASANITHLRIDRLEGADADVRLVDLQLDPERQTWPIKLEEREGLPKEALLGIIDFVRAFRVDRFINDRFTVQNQLDEQNPRPWNYRLVYEVSLPSGGERPRVETREWLLSDRLAGTIQAGTSERHGVTVFLPAKFIEAFEEIVNPVAAVEEQAVERPFPDVMPEPLTAPSP